MQRAIITGASSGIGAAMARELSRRGYALALLARRTDLIQQLASELPNTVAFPCDVTDKSAVADAVARADDIDVAIANAGVGVSGWATKLIAEAEQMMRVNYFGMLYLFDAVIPKMMERRSGRFAGIASLAGLRGLPTAAGYSASKAAMQAYLEAARVELKKFTVRVITVNPGFIDTPMTEKNKFKMPFLMKPEEAASVIADGIERGKRVVEFPRPISMLMRTVRMLPDAIFDRVMIPAGARRKIDPSKVKR